MGRVGWPWDLNLNPSAPSDSVNMYKGAVLLHVRWLLVSVESGE